MLLDVAHDRFRRAQLCAIAVGFGIAQALAPEQQISEADEFDADLFEARAPDRVTFSRPMIATGATRALFDRASRVGLLPSTDVSP